MSAADCVIPGAIVLPMVRPRIQVVLDDVELSSGMRGAIEATGAEIALASFSHPPGNGTHSNDSPSTARLLVTRDGAAVTNGKLHKLLEWCDRDPCATLVVTDDPSLPADVDVGGRPIAFAAGLSASDLAARLSGMCTAYSAMQSLREEVARLRRREGARSPGHTRLPGPPQPPSAAPESDRERRLADDLRLAGALQRDLLPARLPAVRGLELRALYRPVHAVGGDVYDVCRLDDRRLAFWLADAAGHDVSAGMIAAFVRGLFLRHARAGAGGFGYEPDRLLAEVNADLLAVDFTECQFVTAVYGVFDESIRRVAFARAGAPYPLLIRASGSRVPLRTSGPILGIAEASPESFSVGGLELGSGDGLLVFSDGLESLFSASGSVGLALERTADHYECSDSDGGRRGASEPDAFAYIARAQAWLDHTPDGVADDVTALALRAC